MLRIYSRVVVVLAVVVFCAGCPLHQKPIPWGQLTVEQKASYMMSVYNSQYDDYTFKAALPDLTEAEKKILREKKKVLTYVYPLLESYIVLSVETQSPSGDTEQKIFEALGRLVDLAVRNL